MNDINQTLDASHPEISEREKQLEEKLGSRLLLIWLLGAIVLIELLIIVQVAR